MSLLSLKRGLDLLNCFDEQNKYLTAQQLASRLDVPLSTVYRYLEILTEQQFLHKNPTSRLYNLGTAIHRLVHLVGSDLPVVSLAMPYMEKLARQTNETIFLTVLVNYRSVCIKKIESNRRVKLTIDEGSHQLLHAGASSRILLAYQEEHFFRQWLSAEDMPRYTDNTICDENSMVKELEHTRNQGFAVSDGETDEGAMAVAAPVFDATGKLMAGLSLAGPSERIKSLLPELTRVLVEATNQISGELGFGQSANAASHEG